MPEPRSPQGPPGHGQPSLGPHNSGRRRTGLLWACAAAVGLVFVLLVVAAIAIAMWIDSNKDSAAPATPTQTSNTASSLAPTSEAPAAATGTPTSPTPSTEEPSELPAGSNPQTKEEAKSAFYASLPEKIENWEITDVRGDKIYKDGDRQISFLFLSLSEDSSNPSLGYEGEEVFERGSCAPNTQHPDAISCLIFPRATGDAAYFMTSRSSDMEEMIRISQAVIAGK